MINIKKYNSFFESFIQDDYDIYQFYEDIKSTIWDKDGYLKDLKKYCDIFIGDGIYDKIVSKSTNMISKLDKIDYDYINDRLVDIYDKFTPGCTTNHTSGRILYGHYENYNKPDRLKYNASINFKKESDVILHILREILSPTLFSRFPRKNLRTTESEIYVTDKKFQCINLENIPGYDVHKIIDMYQPAIYIHIGDHNEDYKINLKYIESDLDDILPVILDDIDYKMVIFDNYREDRLYDSNTEVADYTLKILLK